MRRSSMMLASAVCLAGALAVGPLGTAAAAPFVYGCTPATLPTVPDVYQRSLSIYNGSTSTASLTHKILAGNGTILNSISSFPTTSSVLPTRTEVFTYTVVGGIPDSDNGTIGASVRIVSNVPVAATFSHDTKSVEDWKPIGCVALSP
jgi:hypothetical protein